MVGRDWGSSARRWPALNSELYVSNFPVWKYSAPSFRETPILFRNWVSPFHQGHLPIGPDLDIAETGEAATYLSNEKDKYSSFGIPHGAKSTTHADATLQNKDLDRPRSFQALLCLYP